ncbi:class I SAM-dependent methyltransferase [Microbulbifer guangxiensis]|uniref:class I SAM-dependent methyltransferase n=1 Tax=Microbulbifer guangxiensis TaxID=2904249 RepID=UPI001F20EE6F|nr:class I SAM-dependent methyltransferase [Microbulbifer guangxiensis]
MTDSEFSDEKVLRSWRRNAEPWQRAINRAEIGSRVRVTDAAIVAAALGYRPRAALDIGCGEAWLCRALASEGVVTWGVDAVPALIQAAQRRSEGMDCQFMEMRYEEMECARFPQRFDLLVCNFSLIGEQSVQQLLAAAPTLLQPGGHLLIQTLHPCWAGDGDYQSGWRQGSWEGFNNEFRDPPPWYFRTLGDWIALLGSSGLALCRLDEPVDPATGKPASVIFHARPV